MRSFILPAMIVMALSSCASYQYVTLDSTDVRKNDKKEFSWENDTMRMTYNFRGENGPITMSIFNKTDKPLYVNWKKSAMIRGTHATSLFNSNVQINGTFAGYGRRYTIGSLSASFDMPEGMDLIPPGSDLTKNLDQSVETTALLQSFFSDSAKSVRGLYPDGGSYKFKRYYFDASQSPLQFKSYLTFVLGYNNSLEFSLSHTFYANEVLLTKEEPLYFANYLSGGDKMYLKKREQQ